MPEELFIRISILIGRVSPSVIETSSIAAAESEWMPILPCSTRPGRWSTGQATRSTAAASSGPAIARCSSCRRGNSALAADVAHLHLRQQHRLGGSKLGVAVVAHLPDSPQVRLDGGVSRAVAQQRAKVVAGSKRSTGLPGGNAATRVQAARLVSRSTPNRVSLPQASARTDGPTASARRKPRRPKR